MQNNNNMTQAAETTSTYSQYLNGLRTQKDAKKVFNDLNLGFDYSLKSYEGVAYDILDCVRLESGFVADIAKKFLSASFEMTDKQKWCVAFAFIKITWEIK